MMEAFRVSHRSSETVNSALRALPHYEEVRFEVVSVVMHRREA
jgi:hypothetical protein